MASSQVNPAGSDMFAMWKELQSSWLSNLSQMVEKSFETSKLQPESFQAFTESWMKSQSEFLRKGLEMKHLFPNPEMTQRFMGAMDSQLQIFRWWADTIVKGAMGGAMGDPKTLLEMWSKSYRSVMGQLLPGTLADPLRQLIEAGSGWPGKWAEMMGGWSQVATDAMKRAWQMGGSDGSVPPAAVKDFYDSWVKGYEETLGRWFGIPTLGPLRRNQELYQSCLDAYMRLCAASFDYSVKLLDPNIKAFEELAQKTAVAMKGELTPETFRQIYQKMIQTAEEQFRILFESEEFVHSMQTTLEASLEFYHKSQKLVEEYLKTTPIITRTEMDEVHEEVHALRREVESLRKELNKLARSA
ncbi:MAG: hypothetical protein FJ125_11520, partial [Deltaproteobacteria bacterium]|nr:hypothetical protein [Deltaproteobacteria bacterium]